MVIKNKKKKFTLQTYEPEERMTITRHDATNIIMNVGSRQRYFGNWLYLAWSGFIMALKGIFTTKSKVDEALHKNEKVMDLTKQSFQH